MRRLITASLVGFALLLTGCGDSEPDDAAPDTSASDPAEPGADDTDEEGTAGGLADTDVPECPFTTEEVNDLTGITLNEDPDAPCLWRNESGSGLVSVNMASELAVSTTYDYSREMADERFDLVEEIDGLDLGYRGAGELNGEAVVLTDLGGYTVLTSSLAGTAEENMTMIRALADHVVENH